MTDRQKTQLIVAAVLALFVMFWLLGLSLSLTGRGGCQLGLPTGDQERTALRVRWFSPRSVRRDEVSGCGVLVQSAPLAAPCTLQIAGGTFGSRDLRLRSLHRIRGRLMPAQEPARFGQAPPAPVPIDFDMAPNKQASVPVPSAGGVLTIDCAGASACGFGLDTEP